MQLFGVWSRVKQGRGAAHQAGRGKGGQAPAVANVRKLPEPAWADDLLSHRWSFKGELLLHCFYQKEPSINKLRQTI